MKPNKIAFFGNEIDPDCSYCGHSQETEGAFHCSLHRELSAEGQCRKFTYDPLRRMPEVQPPLPKFDPEEFRL